MRLTHFTDYSFPRRLSRVETEFLGFDSRNRRGLRDFGKSYDQGDLRARAADLIETLRGRHGGLRLARPAAMIGLGDVVRAAEPELALVECQAGAPCAIDGACRLHAIMDEASKRSARRSRPLQQSRCHPAEQLRLVASPRPFGNRRGERGDLTALKISQRAGRSSSRPPRRRRQFDADGHHQRGQINASRFVLYSVEGRPCAGEE